MCLTVKLCNLNIELKLIILTLCIIYEDVLIVFTVILRLLGAMLLHNGNG